MRQAEDADRRAGVQPYTGYNILIVDDEDDFRELLRSWFERRGGRVMTAEDGDAAIAAAGHFMPDLILMDIGMPNRSGISATYKIRKLPGLQNVPVLAVTAYSSPKLHEDAIKAGCLECLVKPFDLARLEQLISRLTGA